MLILVFPGYPFLQCFCFPENDDISHFFLISVISFEVFSALTDSHNSTQYSFTCSLSLLHSIC